MDLTQKKLTKKEWEGTEIPVSAAEQSILNMLANGFTSPNVRHNRSQSLFSYLKIPPVAGTTDYLYKRYIGPAVDDIVKKHPLFVADVIAVVDNRPKSKYKPNQADQIRLDRSSACIDTVRDQIFEFVLLENLKKLIRYEKKLDHDKVVYYWYTLNQLTMNRIISTNDIVLDIVKKTITRISKSIDVKYLLRNSTRIMERNETVVANTDIQLYEHQRRVFNIFSNPAGSKLVQYLAPTATGKTMTPLGLSSNYRVIFVCAARHVGLALARAAISVERKIAFAFGASCAEDIRLHYYAAKDYTKDRRSGGIRKVDNTVGDKVEIMICDLKSYLPAMLYMLAFNPAENIILYWDEPTISLDYAEHDCHEIIANNWRENQIPNIILSSATLPETNSIRGVLDDFKARFPAPEVFHVSSRSSTKTIPILNREGFVEMPHYIIKNHDDAMDIAMRCIADSTTFRHIDLTEAVRFIGYLHESTDDVALLRNKAANHRYHMDAYFDDIEDIRANDIKKYYLELIQLVVADKWSAIATDVLKSRKTMYDSTVRITTDDAYSLTDGPTIYIAEDIEKIGKHCIKQSAIPTEVLQNIMKDISYNNKVNEKLASKERDLEDKLAKDEATGNDKKIAKLGEDKKGGGDRKQKGRDSGGGGGGSGGGSSRVDDETKALIKDVRELEKLVRTVDIEDVHVPNSPAHIARWAADRETGSAFKCNISSDIVERIMLINEVSDIWKLLLLCGIGVFTSHTNIKYTEIMKELADTQKLFMIIGSSDFIYGTNYQFCHGYIGADLHEMTQQKITQCIGRVGRAATTSTYSIRVRSNELIERFFRHETNTIEADNMNRLFGGSSVLQATLPPLPPTADDYDIIQPCDLK